MPKECTNYVGPLQVLCYAKNALVPASAESYAKNCGAARYLSPRNELLITTSFRRQRVLYVTALRTRLRLRSLLPSSRNVSSPGARHLGVSSRNHSAPDSPGVITQL